MVSQSSFLFGPGSRLGRYRVDRPLAAGGFAEVYVGRDEVLDRPVALKVVRRPADGERERRGIQILSRLSHPNLVAVHAADWVEGRLVVAMDLVDGESLRDRLDRQGPLPVQEAVSIAAAICDALDYVHHFDFDGLTGFAHLDVKPANVLVDTQGRVRVADFGLARHTSRSVGNEPLAGSPTYMAPEQRAGDGTPESDQWAVGVVLHELVTGFPPENGVLDASLPPGLRTVIARCLAPDPTGRYSAMGELAEVLRACGDSRGGGRCERCGSPLTGDECGDCTVALGGVEERAVVRRPTRWIRVAAAVLVVAAAGVGVAVAVRTPEVNWRSDLAEISAIEAAGVGDYDDLLGRYQAFEAAWPERPEAEGVRHRRQELAREASAYAAARHEEPAEHLNPSEGIRQWRAFQAVQRTGWRLSESEETIARLQARLRAFNGWAQLTVTSARGLVAGDLSAFRWEQPDPYFVLLVDEEFVYRSVSLVDTPAPRWDETARLRLHPAVRVRLEIHDRNVLSDRLLGGLDLDADNLPEDGPFTVGLGSMAVDLVLAREWPGAERLADGVRSQR